MRIRHTIFFILCCVTIGLAATIYISLNSMMSERFKALEAHHATQDVLRATNAVQNVLLNLDRFLWDWASWDDTYGFMRSRSGGYIESNLVDSTFMEQRLNIILFTDLQGDLVWGKSLDLDSGKAKPLPKLVLQMLRPGGSLHNTAAPSSPRTGLLQLDGGVLLVAARPVLPSGGEGKPRGILFMGRYLNDELISRIKEATQLEMQFFSVQDPSLPESIDPTGAVTIVRESPESLLAYTMLEGGVGGPTTVMCLRFARDIFQEGAAIIRGTLAPLFVAALLFVAATMYLLDRKVVKRLHDLGIQVAQVARSAGGSTRVREDGFDEVAELAQGVNQMLAELENSKTELAERMRESLENEAFLEKLLNSVQAGIVLVDPQTREVVEANDFALKLIGSSKSELVGVMCQKAFCLASNGRCPILDDGKDVALKQCQLRRSDKSRLEIIKSVTTVERKGRPYLLETFIDISGMHKAQQELRRAHDNMETKVEERTQELQEANKELRKLNSLKSTFLNSASHELRTPLTSVIGFVKLMEKQFAKWFEPLAQDDENLRKRAEDFRANFAIMELESERLKRLINDMLDLSRIESGRMQWRDEPLELTGLLREVAASLMPHFREREDVVLEVDVPESLPVLTADGDRIKQVVLNLLHNADKFTRSGAVRLHARAEADGFITIAVSDTGKGIPSNEVAQIFDVFYQSAQQGDATKVPGAGLGLAICREIVQHYGGAIWAESVEGTGSTFSFTLPPTAQ